jgi:hypothetical protein
MKKDRTNKYKPTANPAYAEGMREIRKSNASGTHLDKRTRRQRTRQSAIHHAIIEQMKEGN